MRVLATLPAVLADVRGGVTVFAVGLALVTAPGLLAQTPVSTPVVGPGVTTAFPATRAFDLRQVRSAQACAEAVLFIEDSVQQYWQRDTLYVDERRPTPPVVAQVARQCLQMFPIPQIDTLELPTVLKIALYTGDTVPVTAVLDRQLALRTGGEGRAEVVMNVLRAVKSIMHPVSLPLLQGLLARLDALGPEALLEQFSGRRAVYDSYERRGAPPDSMVAQAGEMLAALQRLTTAGEGRGAARGFADSVDYFRREFAWYTYVRDGTPAAFETWRALVTRWKNGGLLGTPAPLIEGEFWMHGAIGEDTTPPRPAHSGGVPFPDRVTVIFGGGARELSANTKWRELDLLRRIHARFPAVKLVMLAQTQGAVLGQRYLEDPAAEAAVVGQMYLDSLRLPIWINFSRGVIDTSRWDAWGRPLIFNCSTYDNWRAPWEFSGIYIVNRHGYVVRRINASSVGPEHLFMLLARLLQIDAPTSVAGE